MTAVGPHGKPLDECWEALVEETESLPEVERGSLNTALKAIKASCAREGITPDLIPSEIRRRADLYRTGNMAQCTLSPMALAKNWLRVLNQRAALSPEQQALNRLRSSSHGSVTL